MPDDVRELVRRCLKGDQLAIHQLVDQFRGPVFGLCLRMLGNRQDAEDTAQESFIRALRSLDRWDPARDFRPWLFAIAGNRCRSVLAVRKRRPPPAPLLEDNLPDNSPDVLSQRSLLEEVRRALAQVREEYRQAFLLYHEQELSYAEISEAFDRPVGTIKTWIHRARGEVAAILIRRGVVEETKT